MRGHRLAVRAAAGLLVTALLLLMGAQQALAAVGWGDTGDKVRQVQQKLSQWGYYSGAVDGVFGQATYDAVVRFQQKNGLRADGLVGSATAAAMGISLSGGSVAASS